MIAGKRALLPSWAMNLLGFGLLITLVLTRGFRLAERWLRVEAMQGR